MTVEELDRLPAAAARAALERCCGAARWLDAMLARRPFGDADRLLATAEVEAESLGPDDWREAFAHHPRIGDREALRARFASTAAWAQGEQAGAVVASDAVLDALSNGNRAYEERFGYIFVVCATGRSAEEMLEMLERRLTHAPEEEWRVAAREQRAITRLRLLKLLGEESR